MTPIYVDSILSALPACCPAVDVRQERLSLAEPFRISGRLFEHIDTIVVRLTAGGRVGWGEAAGVFYLGDVPETMLSALAEAKAWIEQGLDHATLAARMPPGGARNAIDCALWDLQAQLLGKPVWALLGMEQPRRLLTTFTIGNAPPAAMAVKAKALAAARAIKIKLTGDADDAERVRAVRAARPGTWLAVDANRSLTPGTLLDLLPTLVAAEVALIEQPFPVELDAAIAEQAIPIPVAADESVQTIDDLERLAHLYQIVNIKLDKCGGLTEGLRIARRAHALGLRVMVGNMIGTSLAMAPAFLLGQYCSVVDLDGPTFLRADRQPTVAYHDGFIACPASVWGGGAVIAQAEVAS